MGVKLKKIINEKEIKFKIEELSILINEKYKNRELVVLPVMNGAFFFAHDIFKNISIDFQFDLLFCSSYYGGLKSKGKVSFQYEEKISYSINF